MGYQQNIRNNYTRGIECRLLTDKYYDYMLYKGGTIPLLRENECLASFINMNDDASYLVEDSGITSVLSWYAAKSSDFSLDHIGMTGIDNGKILYDKDVITQEEFNDIFLNSKLNITSGDTRLKLFPVSGNTKAYDYNYAFAHDENDKYIALNGGFFQGFFKVPEEDYEVLPYYIDDDWHFEFVIRPQSGYTESGHTLNSVYPENKGIFFFMGARAENKFAEITNQTDAFVTPYTGETLGVESGLSTYSFVTDNKHIFFNRTKTGSTVHNWDEEETGGYALLEADYVKEYKDNAHSLFNRTETGYTAYDAKGNENGCSKCSGPRKTDIYSTASTEYNIMKDVIGNAFALKYNDDGSISYKYTMHDCDAEEGWSLQEETTKPYLVKDGEWNVINVRFSILDNSSKKCFLRDEFGNIVYDAKGVPVYDLVPTNVGNRKMKIYIYVNGYLVLVSKELNEFRFRELAVEKEYQEGVPFNISLGGGTQGLAERVFPDYKAPVTAHYYLEKNYAGTFDGDLRVFRMYTCREQFMDIHNSYLNEITEKEDVMVKDNVLYYGFALDSRYIIEQGTQQTATTNMRTRYTAKSAFDDAHFYVVISKKYIGAKPVEFTCGGAPMVMEQEEVVIGGKPCIVYKSGEIYAPDTELSILSENR